MQGILLSGDHATIPDAELAALLAIDAPDASVHPVTSRVRIVGGGATQRMVSAIAWGDHWAYAPDSEQGLQTLAANIMDHATGTGSIAVRTTRYGQDKRDSLHVAKRLGQALVDAGHTVDLQEPDMEIYAWIGEGTIAIGHLHGTRTSFESRNADNRSHFSPISLHPRRAASLVHLARVPPGGTILDPFCGTGGIALEAALLGYDVWASDLDPFMVQGTLQTLTDAGPEPLDGNVLHADIAAVPALVGHVDGIVTDLPYGGASSTHDEDIAGLYARAFESFAALLRPGAHAVVGHRDTELMTPAQTWFDLQEAHEEYAHKSLTRRFVVLRRR